MSTTLTPPKERTRRDSGSGTGGVWRVIVLNDDHNTFEGVAFALAQTVPGVDYNRGMALANRIHNTGRAIVWSGHKEAAELYWQELRGHGLTMAPLERV
jgi:ATP-dependent Clp protease adaptor protein ClpS